MSQPNLNEDLNIVANSNIEITLLDGDLNIIQALDDEPNDVGGLTSAELKAKFDEGPNKIKTYINETLIPEILTEEATEAARAAAEAVREANEAQRIENENARIAAEQARVDETNGVVAQANQAAQSWAVGGTGTREGEDTNNAKYWSEQAAAAACGGVTSFKGRTGSVIPASGDYTAEMVGAYSKEETNTLLQNKAPAGNGYDGKELPYYYYTTDDELFAALDALLETMPNSSAKQICFGSPGVDNYTFCGTIFKDSPTIAALSGFTYGPKSGYSSSSLHRICLSVKTTKNGVWCPFEWDNPPMQRGLEYRTTERYQGKPVYVKLVDFGALPNATTKIVNFAIENNAQLLECKGFIVGGGILPYSYPGSSAGTANVYINKSAGYFSVFVSTDVDLSRNSAYFILKYTKTTD